MAQKEKLMFHRHYKKGFGAGLITSIRENAKNIAEANGWRVGEEIEILYKVYIPLYGKD